MKTLLTYFVLLSFISTLGCSNATTPEPTHFSFTYSSAFTTGAVAVPWHSTVTQFFPAPSFDSVTIGGTTASDQFTISVRGVTSAGTYTFGSGSNMAISALFIHLGTPYMMLPNSSITFSNFKNSTLTDAGYDGTFTGKMVGIIAGKASDTLVVTSGVFHIPN